MKSLIQIIFILLSITGIGIAQPVLFNPLNGPNGGYVQHFALNEQGDILVDQFGITENAPNQFKTGIQISRDGGNNWNKISGSFSTNQFVAHPDGSFYTLYSSSWRNEIQKLPFGSDTIVESPIASLNDLEMRTFTIDENGTFFAINEQMEIFSSINEGISWDSLTQGTWNINYNSISLFAPKSSDYIYVIHNDVSSRKEAIYRFKKDGSEIELVIETNSERIFNMFHNPGEGYIFINSTGAFYSVDGFSDWTKITSNTVPTPLFGGTWSTNGDLIVISDGGYFQSLDLGLTWTQLPGKDIYKNHVTTELAHDPQRNRYYAKNLSSETFNFYSIDSNFSNWDTIVPQDTAPPIARVFIDKENNIYAGVAHYISLEIEGFHKSTDGGNTFIPFRPMGSEVGSITEGANGVLFILSYNDTLYRSTDNGNTWMTSLSDSTFSNTQTNKRYSFVKGHKNGTIIANFLESINGYPYNRNQLWLSNDNGISWNLIDRNHYYEGRIDIAIDGSIYGAFSQPGGAKHLVKYDQQSLTWDTLRTATSGGSFNEIVISDTGVIYIKESYPTGDDFWLISEDNGASFLQADFGNIQHLTSASNGYLVALDYPQNVILSKNNGLSWEILYSQPGHSWYDFHFSNDNFIYAALQGDYIRKSEKLIFNDNFIVGNVFYDKNKTCVFDNDDKYTKDILVSAEGLDTFYVTTRSDGRFIIPVPAGTYDVKITVPSPLWEACDSIQTVSLSGINDTTFIDFGMKAIVDCPHLNVDLTNSILRRCFENEYQVQYCNEGTVAAADAQVEITLDPRFSITTSEIPWSNITGNTYTFPVGDIDIFECKNFSFYTEMICDSVVLDETICAEAHITPDSICLSPNPNWSGASLQVTGECEGDSMIFIIKNVGAGDMVQARQYIVIEDVAIMRVSNPFKLPSGDSERIAIEALGQTVHVEVPQIEGHPGLSAPSATLERCGTPFQLGLFNQFGQNDLGNTVDIECRTVTGSYDPNDKQAVPTGWDEKNFIQPNSTIEYLIRFQNTGTDTAFNVFILDTISTWLDITTLDVGAGSHEYDYEIYDNGILRFNFKNIMLPDSNISQSGSNGFIKYKIKLKDNVSLGTVIYNAADIYFDFNDPIYTNQTYHTVEIPSVMVKTQEVFIKGAEVNVYPNPFSEKARFDLKHSPQGLKQFNLFSLTGKKMHSQIFEQHQFVFQRNQLPKGIYFYEIKKGEIKIAVGKLVVE